MFNKNKSGSEENTPAKGHFRTEHFYPSEEAELRICVVLHLSLWMPQCWGQWHTQILSPRVWIHRWKVRRENTTGTGPKIVNSNPLWSQSTVVHTDTDLPKNQLISGLTIYLIYTKTPSFSLSTFYLVWEDLIFLVSKERHPSDTTLCWAILLRKDRSS